MDHSVSIDSNVQADVCGTAARTSQVAGAGTVKVGMTRYALRTVMPLSGHADERVSECRHGAGCALVPAQGPQNPGLAPTPRGQCREHGEHRLEHFRAEGRGR
jgi:hypothetical protein